VAACSRYRSDNPEESRFCGACGARLDAAPDTAREERKVVRALEFYRGVEGSAFAREAESLVRSTA
jgi:hypothetical protein